MIDILKGEINFLKSAWQNLLGRPLITLVMKNLYLGRLKILKIIVELNNIFKTDIFD